MTIVRSNSLKLKPLMWGRVGLWTVTFLLCWTSVTLAAEKKPQPEEFRKPLEITKPDPLLPQWPKKKTPLTPEEQAALRQSLDELDGQATALLEAGKADEAFEVWYRELRLRRALGPVEEVQALGRVGEIAWRKNRGFDTQVISKRLREIQQEAQQKKAFNLELLQALGKAFQQVRLPEPAIAVYQQILADERQRGDTEAEEESLKTLAQLNMDWFNYPEAAKIYEELLDRSRARGDRVRELAYLEQLIYAYNKAQQPENAVKVKQKLAETYSPNDPRLPALKIAIASDYEALGQQQLATAAESKAQNQPTEASKNEQKGYAYLDQASQTYQQAYELARVLQQWAYASEALQKLAALYRTNNQPENALQVYDVLVKTQQHAYNFYGLMNTYDQMGQIYLEQGKYAQARDVFQKGLELAKSLQYQENYFATKLEQTTQQRSP